jgi:tetratricopeptide (TPR) repeat protein
MSVQLFEQWQQTPRDVALLSRWVSLVQEKSQQREAIEQLACCIEQADETVSASVHVALINLHLDLGDLTRADDHVNALHLLKPESYQSYFYKARILQRLNKREKAKEAFKQAIHRQQDHEESWRGLVDCTVKSGDLIEALNYVAEARKLAWPSRWQRFWTYKQGCIYQMMTRYSLAMVSFAEVILDCTAAGIPQQREKKSRMSQVPPSAPLAALRAAIALLEGQGLQAFPTAGTLLGWWREGNFLPHDKDIDIALPPGSDWGKAEAAVSASPAFRVIPSEMGYSNFISMMHVETGMVVDISHHEEAGEGQVGCVWRIPGLPDEQCRRTLQSPYQLVRDEWLGGEFWRPGDPDRYLTDVYGDWRTPMKSFDTLISGLHLVGFPDCVRCYAYNRLAHALSEGSLTRGLSYLAQILQKDPLDPVSNHVRNHLASRQSEVVSGEA